MSKIVQVKNKSCCSIFLLIIKVFISCYKKKINFKMIWYIFDKENSLWKLKFHIFKALNLLQEMLLQLKFKQFWIRTTLILYTTFFIFVRPFLCFQGRLFWKMMHGLIFKSRLWWRTYCTVANNIYRFWADLLIDGHV